MIEWLRRELWMWFGYRDDYEAAMSRIATGMADVDRLIDDGHHVAAQAAINRSRPTSITPGTCCGGRVRGGWNLRDGDPVAAGCLNQIRSTYHGAGVAPNPVTATARRVAAGVRADGERAPVVDDDRVEHRRPDGDTEHPVAGEQFPCGRRSQTPAVNIHHVVGEQPDGGAMHPRPDAGEFAAHRTGFGGDKFL